MVYIFYTRVDKRLNNDTFSYYLKHLPSVSQTKILKYKYWEDAQRSLLGKALLMKGLNLLGLTRYSLFDLKFTKFHRPYFDDSIDFNISHSGVFVICAISITNKIGVDVEEIKGIQLDDFINNFSEKEWQEILKKDNGFYSFYKHWTQKEAFLKAIGMGLNVPIREVEILDNKITWDNNEWFLQEIKLDERYIAHLSSNISLSGIIVKKINYI
jgi:4'-phosphopantetheinyl transferase